MSNELGEFLEKLRGKLSLREAGVRAQLSHTYIRDLELGINRKTKAPIKPSPDTLKRLADAYDYSYEELMKKAGYFDEDALIASFEKEESQKKEEEDQSPIPHAVRTWLRADTTGLTREQQELLKDDLADYFEYRRNKLLKEKDKK